jgi:uncharacterized protein (DUF1697 family)
VALHAAFLRGMNLGGRRITNDDLRAQFEELGFESVATFRASGNVVFEAAGVSEAKLRKRIEEGLEDGLGYAVPTFIRSARELREIEASEPFAPSDVKSSKGKLQVALLAAAPSRAAPKKALGLATDDDRLAFGKRELYWLPSGGVSDSELDVRALERLTGAWTMRTMGTIEQIAAKFLS